MSWLMVGSLSYLQAHVSAARHPGVSELIPRTEECVDLQYMRATANNPVGLYSCAGLQNAGAKDKGINWPLVNVTTAKVPQILVA
jgi:hypothetical protein